MRIRVFFLIFLVVLSGNIFASEAKYLTKIISPSFTSSVFRSNSSSFDDNTILVNIDINSLLDKDVVNGKSKLAIHLNENKTIYIPIKKIKNNKNSENFSWIGDNKTENTQAIISVRNGKLVGTVIFGDKEYKIVPKDGNYVIYKNTKEFVSLENDMVFQEPKKDIPEDISNKLNYAKYLKISKSTSSTTNIDILFLYTKSFYQKNGNNSALYIQNMIDEASDIYDNSKTNVIFNTVGILPLPENSGLNPTHSNPTDYLNELSKDGYVEYLRTKYKADIVSLITVYNHDGLCGIGITPVKNFPSTLNAFSIVYGYSYCGGRTLAHEVGHNFGCYHDTDHVSSGYSPIYDYAYGYDIYNKFATVMSYDSPGINYFSNPNLTYGGYAIGNSASADNARVIREQKDEVATNGDKLSVDLELTDSMSEYTINGVLGTNYDKDQYIVKLEGETTVSGYASGYLQWYFYVNIYDSNHNLIISNDGGGDKQFVTTLSKGTYFMNINKGNWNGDYTKYHIEISTNYSGDDAKMDPSIIMYLLN